jgi:DNA-binding MarR family transcriptional regulator
MAKRVPDISQLQFLALGALLAGERPGRELREVAGEFGVRGTRAAFYQLMARLERAGLVEGWYAPVRVDEQTVTERHYRVTASGRRAWSEARAFHAAVERLSAGSRPSNA